MDISAGTNSAQFWIQDSAITVGSDLELSASGVVAGTGQTLATSQQMPFRFIARSANHIASMFPGSGSCPVTAYGSVGSYCMQFTINFADADGVPVGFSSNQQLSVDSPSSYGSTVYADSLCTQMASYAPNGTLRIPIPADTKSMQISVLLDSFMYQSGAQYDFPMPLNVPTQLNFQTFGGPIAPGQVLMNCQTMWSSGTSL